MATNPVEENPVTRWLLGMAVIFGMMLGGAAGAQVFATVPVPYASVLGVLIGALLVLVGFSVWYTRYHRAATGGSEAS